MNEMAETIMSDAHKEILQRNRNQIVKNLRMDDIMNELTSTRILLEDLNHVQEIRSQIGYRQTEYFLDILSKRPDSSFQKFITVLKSNGQEHIASLLDLPRQGQKRVSMESTSFGIDIKRVKQELDARMFLDNHNLTVLLPLALGPAYGPAKCLTVVNDELFVARIASTQVSVYSTVTFTHSRDLSINATELVGSSSNNCLYISDAKMDVHRYNLSNNFTTRWFVGGMCHGLSETSTGSVLVTLGKTRQLKEYLASGSLMREICLDSSIRFPLHSVQMSSDRLVVLHDDQVSIVDMKGKVIDSYGRLQMAGSPRKEIDPSQMAVDRNGNVIVSDWCNHRVVLLSPSLTLLGYVTIPGHQLRHPRALHLDQLKNRLYVGEAYGYDKDGRVLVLGVR